MTDERKTTDSGKVDDRLVSETYRDTAAETVPEHLNVAVLRTASKAARPKYSLMRTWTRPVAWAAVVMLSFALVLELTQTPVPSGMNQELSAPASFAEPDAELREYESLGDDSAGLAKRERPLEDVQELKVKDADMLQRAEDMARMQQGPVDEPVPAVPAAAEPVSVDTFSADEEVAVQAVMPLPEKNSMRSAAGHIDMESACDESERADPQSWLACITALEEDGQSEVASAERQLLQAAFPGFSEE